MKPFIKFLTILVGVLASQLVHGQNNPAPADTIVAFKDNLNYFLTTGTYLDGKELKEAISNLQFNFDPDSILYVDKVNISVIAMGGKNIGLSFYSPMRNEDETNVEINVFNSVPVSIFGFANKIEVTTMGSESKRINYLAKTNIFFTGGKFNSLNLNTAIQTLSIKRTDFSSITLNNVLILNHFELINVEVDTINFGATQFPDTIKLEDLRLNNMNGVVDFTHQNKNHMIAIVANVDLNKLDIPYDKFDFIIDTAKHSYEQTAILYQQLLKRLSDEGLSEKYEKYSKQFLNYKYSKNNQWIINFIAKNWWDYGYDKVRVFYIACGFFIFFFIINCLFIGFLKDTYWPVKFQEYDLYIHKEFKGSGKKKLFFLYKYSFGIFLYTAFLFWGLKLELKELDLKNRGAIFLIIVQYVMGVICLAYLANYVLSK